MISLALGSRHVEAFIHRQNAMKKGPFAFIFHSTQRLNSPFEKNAQQNDDCNACVTSTSNNSTLLDPLQPFLPAYDPMYSVRGPVGQGDFIISRDNGPTPEELTNQNLFKVLKLECTDLEVNTLVWKALGYRFNAEREEWMNDLVFPKWKTNFPTPPDLLGMKRVYSKEIDTASLKANQQLVRSIPMEFKQSLKTHLRPLGFTGYKYEELTPNKTRRAQCVNWLLYYREELFGYSVDELLERKRLREGNKAAQEGKILDTDKDSWTSPVKEVFIE